MKNTTQLLTIKQASVLGKFYNQRVTMAMKTIENEELLFYITKKTMQNEVLEKIGRYLTENELSIAEKGLEWSLSFDIDTVYNTILFEMIKI